MLDRPNLARVLQDRLSAELKNLRCGAAPAHLPKVWPDTLPIGADGLGADSLDTLSLAAAANEMFHIHETGIEDALLIRRRFGDWVDLVEQAWAVNSEQISFQTSGSTGRARRCPHRMRALLEEAAEHARRLRPRRILSAVPSHHIYGFLFTVLLPRLAGCQMIDISTRLPTPADCGEGDVIVSFPDHWRFLQRSLARLPAVTGITSTAPMPGDLANALLGSGLSRLIEIYGASETAGIGWREGAAAPFTLLDLWSVVEAPADEGILHLRDAQGRLAATQDSVLMTAARSFHLMRRHDGAVQVGGINVFPKDVAALLETHPLVAHARVRLMAEHEGSRLKALVVPKVPQTDAAALVSALEAWMEAHLQVAQRPRRITVALEVPAGMLGKEIDW